MAAPNINHARYNQRLAHVHTILESLDLQAADIEPVAYFERAPFAFNNFLYKITLTTPLVSATLPTNSPQQPCTTPPPSAGVSTLILKLSNPAAEGLNNTHRVQNDVITTHLVRNALASSGLDNIVPAVYAWQPYRGKPLAADAQGLEPADPFAADEKEYGWILMAYHEGVDLDGEFPSLSEENKTAVIKQIAVILKAIQHIPLPPGVTVFGGMTFDERYGANIVSGQPPLQPGGPFPTYAAFWAAKFRIALADADKSPALKGWRSSKRNVRPRLDALVEDSEVLTRMLNAAGVDVTARVLNHGDLTMNNMLYSPTNGCISALLDFDWACITHPAHEFFSGLSGAIAGSTHPDDDDDEHGQIQTAVLTGVFPDDPAVKCTEQWTETLQAVGGCPPHEMEGIAALEKLRRLEELVAPFALINAAMVARRGPEAVEAMQEETEVALAELLDELVPVESV